MSQRISRTALPTEIKIESGTFQSISGTSVNFSNSGLPRNEGVAKQLCTGVPRPEEIAASWDHIVGLCLGPVENRVMPLGSYHLAKKITTQKASVYYEYDPSVKQFSLGNPPNN